MQVNFGNIPTTGSIVATARNGCRGGYNPEFYYLVKDTADKAYGINVTEFTKQNDGSLTAAGSNGYGSEQFNVVA